ncbi:MAG: hypothetical protein LC135_08065 [Phycisphaerae bacterium]|nr:hypothetical protein [Phycisphaerae bacterium]MCZ2399809.1 hypothetical protein [Phycisphaerae bacterium]
MPAKFMKTPGSVEPRRTAARRTPAAPLAAIGVLLLSGSAAPGATYSTSDVSITIGSDGKVTSILDLTTGVERIKTTIPVYQVHLVSIRTGGEFVAPTGYSLSGNVLTYTFGSVTPAPVVSVQVNTYARYMRFKVTSVTNGGAIEELRFVQLATRDSLDRSAERLMRYNDGGHQRYLGLYQLDEYTQTIIGPAGAGGYLHADVDPALPLCPGFVGRGVALFACDIDLPAVRDVLELVEQGEGLPLGTPVKRLPTLKRSTIFWANFHYNDRQRMLEIAHAVGAGHMLIFRDMWADVQHQYAPLAMWGSYANIKAWVDQCNAEGILVGAHTLPTYLANNSSVYILPGVDPRIRRDRSITLAADLPANQTDGLIQTTTSPAGWPTGEYERDIVIGQELIQYTSLKTSPPYGFLGPFIRAKNQTGAGGLGPQDHATGAAIERLVNTAEGTAYQLGLANGGTAEQIAQVAAAVKQAGFNYVYADGMEEIEPPFGYTTGLILSMYYKALVDAGAQLDYFESSANTMGYSWPLVSVWGQMDYYLQNDTFKREVDRNVPHMSRDPGNPDPRQLGWAPMCHPSFGQTSTDELEYLLARSAAYGVPIVVHMWAWNIDGWLNRDANFALMKKYEEVRLAGVLPAAERELAKTLGRDFMLFSGEDGSHHLLPVQLLNVGDNAASVRGYLSSTPVDGRRYATLWPLQPGGNASVRLMGVNPQDIVVRDYAGNLVSVAAPSPGQVRIPLASRVYIRLSAAPDVAQLFADAIVE